MQVIQCECGETDMDDNRYCIKCKKYRGANLDNIIKRLDGLKFDLMILNRHLNQMGSR